MAMKRRGFLGMLGAAIAVPVLPVTGAAAPAAAPVSRAAYRLALTHAKTRPHVTARGLAYVLKVSREQATSILSEMAGSGVVTPISPSVDGSMRTTSNILINDPWGLERTSRARRTAVEQRQDEARRPTDDQPVSDAMMAHLYRLCRDYGMTLSPRCGIANERACI